MKFSKEFKDALADLPSKEKDKLIIRLLRKDRALTQRLYFELVMDRTVDQQREVVKERLSQKIIDTSENYYSIGYLNMDVRFMSGDINEHVRMTKDKFGELSLNLYMINGVLERNRENILSVTPGRARKFCTAVIARAFKILLSLNKLHEDYFLDVKEDLKKLGELIGDNPYLMDCAIDNGLNVNWLIFGEIPEDLVEIHKELRANGYLK